MLGSFLARKFDHQPKASLPCLTSRPGSFSDPRGAARDELHAHATADSSKDDFFSCKILLPMMPHLSHILLVFTTLAYWTYIIVAASPQALSTLTLANATAPPQHSIQCVQSDAWVTRSFIAGDCFTALAILEDWEVQVYVIPQKIDLCTHLSLDRERKYP